MTTDDLQALRADLIRDEGLRRFPYVDTVGKITIGVGRNLTDRGITTSEAMELLEHDIAVALGALTSRYPWALTLDGVRLRALINLSFNLGIERLSGFQRAMEATRTGQYVVASREFIRSKWALQVGARATRVAAMIATGADQTTM